MRHKHPDEEREIAAAGGLHITYGMPLSPLLLPWPIYRRIAMESVCGSDVGTALFGHRICTFVYRLYSILPPITVPVQPLLDNWLFANTNPLGADHGGWHPMHFAWVCNTGNLTPVTPVYRIAFATHDNPKPVTLVRSMCCRAASASTASQRPAGTIGYRRWYTSENQGQEIQGYSAAHVFSGNKPWLRLLCAIPIDAGRTATWVPWILNPTEEQPAATRCIYLPRITGSRRILRWTPTEMTISGATPVQYLAGNTLPPGYPQPADLFY